MLALGITSCFGSGSESSSVAGSSSSDPASSSPPSSSSVAPSSATSVRPASSSVAPSSASSARSSSTAAPVVSAMAVSTVDFINEAGADFFKFNGTISGFANADAMKMALGLQHRDAADGGLADPLDGEWLIGSAEPAAGDYKYVPTVADGEFEVKIPLAEITFVKGAYDVYFGAKGHYARINLQQADWGTGTVKTGALKLIFRGDRSQIFAEDLPDISLTEAMTFIEGEGDDARVFLKIGGELGSIDAAEFLEKTILVTCERQVGGWQRNVMAADLVTNIVEGDNGYVKIDVTALDFGGYQVKLGFDGVSAPDTTMDTDSYDMRDNPTVLGNKEYAPYYAKDGVGADYLYGCSGLFIEHVATQITQDVTRLEAEDAIIANATVTAKGDDDAVSGEGYLSGMTVTSGWTRRTSSADFIVRVPETSDYIIKIAYKCPATTTSALSLVVNGGTAKPIGTVATEWTVASELVNFTGGAKHTIVIRGVSGVTSQLDYIELVKHANHLDMSFTGDTVEGTDDLSAATYGSCVCGKVALRMDASADLNGNLKTGNKLGKGTSGDYDGTLISSYKFNAAKAGTVGIYAEGAFDARGNDARSYYSGKNPNGSTYDYDPEAETHPTNTVMKINDVEIVLPITNYGALLGTTTYNQFKLFKIADIEVIEGLNEFTITATNSYGLKYNYFAILF